LARNLTILEIVFLLDAMDDITSYHVHWGVLSKMSGLETLRVLFMYGSRFDGRWNSNAAEGGCSEVDGLFVRLLEVVSDTVKILVDTDRGKVKSLRPPGPAMMENLYRRYKMLQGNGVSTKHDEEWERLERKELWEEGD